VNPEKEPRAPWYQGVTRYQWLVLVIASLGWIFDVFEGQIFVASMNEAMTDLLPEHVRRLDREAQRGYMAYYNNTTFAAFLVGGALGGVLFGVMSDRIGRTRTMVYTILMYSAFTFVSALSQAWWHMAIFRFLVAMGVGGEWAVASAMVAEVFPKRARAWSLGIFHASSVFGTYLAIAAGAFIVGNPALRSEEYPSLAWRLGFMVGVFPALLIIWVRISLREPEHWEQARTSALQDLTKKLGSFADLFTPELRKKTLLGVSLAAIGLATFWGAHIYGKDILKRDVQKQILAGYPEAAGESDRDRLLKEHATTLKRWEMLGMLLVTTGGGLGLVCFGPLAEWLGRRGAFLFYHLGGLVIALVLFQWLAGVPVLLLVLPVFGFLTVGMHAGYAIYFPELFPTRLRGTGGGFCFNVGRLIAAPILFLGGWMQSPMGRDLSLEDAASVLSLLFLPGALLLLFAPETKGRDLPE
jgi:MFS family permease